MSKKQLKRVSKSRLFESKRSRQNLSEESDLEQATILLAAKGIVTDLQGILVKLSDISAKQVMSLTDNITSVYDPNKATEFESSVNQAIQGSIENLKDTKETVNNAILVLDGQAPADQNDMSQDDGSEPSTPPADGNDVASDEGSNQTPAQQEQSTPQEGNTEGRAKKESLTRSGNLLESKGKKILESESINSLMTWLFETTSTRMSPEEFKTFTKTAISQAIENPAKMAGWIASKKESVGSYAQSSVPSVGSAGRKAGIRLESKKKSSKTLNDINEAGVAAPIAPVTPVAPIATNTNSESPSTPNPEKDEDETAIAKLKSKTSTDTASGNEKVDDAISDMSSEDQKEIKDLENKVNSSGKQINSVNDLLQNANSAIGESKKKKKSKIKRRKPQSLLAPLAIGENINSQVGKVSKTGQYVDGKFSEPKDDYSEVNPSEPESVTQAEKITTRKSKIKRTSKHRKMQSSGQSNGPGDSLDVDGSSYEPTPSASTGDLF